MRQLLFVVVSFLAAMIPRPGFAQSSPARELFDIQMDLVACFYRENPVGLFWFGAGDRTAAMRRCLQAAVTAAGREGLESRSYMPGILQFGDSVGPTAADSVRLKDWDRCFTESALALGRDLYQGSDIEKMLSYDGVSDRFENRDAATIAGGLARVRTAAI